jgi:hypothetical protein
MNPGDEHRQRIVPYAYIVHVSRVMMCACVIHDVTEPARHYATLPFTPLVSHGGARHQRLTPWASSLDEFHVIVRGPLAIEQGMIRTA